MRLLHLAYERPPHPNAVHHAATEDDARLVLDLLARPHAERRDIADALRNRLKVVLTRPLAQRPFLPVRTSDQLYRLIPWRLAKWLSHVLPAAETTLERTRARITRWLASEDEPRVVRP